MLPLSEGQSTQDFSDFPGHSEFGEFVFRQKTSGASGATDERGKLFQGATNRIKWGLQKYAKVFIIFSLNTILLAWPLLFFHVSNFWYLRSVLFFAWVWLTWRTNFWTVTGSNGMLGMAHKLRQSGTLVESGIPRIKGNTFPRMGPRFCWVGNHGELCWNFRIFIPKIGGNAWKWAMKPSNQLTILLGFFAEFWWSIFWYVQMNPDSNVFWSHGQPPNT